MKLKRTKTKVWRYGKDDTPFKIFVEVDTVIETTKKFLESTFYIVETKNINLLSDVTSLALDSIKINYNDSTNVSLLIIWKAGTHKKKRWNQTDKNLSCTSKTYHRKTHKKLFFEITLGRWKTIA